VECALFVKARIAREQNLEINTQLKECIDMKCSHQTTSLSSSMIPVELPGDRAIVLDTDAIGRAQRRTLTRCGSWRQGATLLASSVLSLSHDEEEKMPIWIEISSTATGEASLYANDDVSYFTSLAARFEASVHVFEPNANRIMRMLKTVKENSQEDTITIHPMYMSSRSSSSSSSKSGVRLCTAQEQCEASVSATRTTLDRTILPVLYQFKGAKRVKWIHLRVRNHDETMNVLRGARKLLGLRWIDTILIDRRSSSSHLKKTTSRDVNNLLLKTGFVSVCLDNTTLASDIGEVYNDEITSLISERHISSYSSCDMIFVSRSETLLFNTLRRASEMANNRKTRQRESLHDVLSEIDRDAELAAENWRSGKGRLWLQRVRGAGGSILCHNLRLNSDLNRNASIVRFGNYSLKVQVQDFTKSYEEDFCTSSSTKSHIIGLGSSMEENHDVKVKDDCCQIESYDFDDMKGLVRHLGERNIVEESKRSLPITSILHQHREDWSRWVFVTSLRGPLHRAVSLLHSESRYCGDENKVCPYDILFQEDTARKNCATDDASYCYSNHMTRVFSGRHGTNNLTHTDLENAKLMLHRFSCILVMESLNRTASCLEDTLGLSTLDLTSGSSRSSIANETNMILSTLPREDLKRLMELNQFDLELWEYALGLLHSRGFY